MTEEEWLSATGPYDMLMSFPAKEDSRKLWLFGCACLRRAWDLIRDQRARNCIEAAERFVDGQATRQEVNEKWEEFLSAAEGDEGDELQEFRGFDICEALRNLICFVDPAASLSVASEVAEGMGSAAASALDRTAPDSQSEERTNIWHKAETEEHGVQAELLRHIFGNPFRPLAVNPTWQTSNVLALAQAIYTDRAFERLPILADALEDAGCDKADILDHCRQPGEHVRGCWVVDLVLGKS
jgi:hypothetical protein